MPPIPFARDVSVRGTPLHRGEFIPLSALLLSTVALAIDIILPVLPAIQNEFALDDPNRAQFVVAALFAGLAFGQLVAGPASDRFGRRPIIMAGLGCFLAGSLAAAYSTSFELLLLGRVMQGLGVAGPRVVTVALIRDLYSGVQMARIMSFVLATFIIVPAVAPAIGQGIDWIFGWRAVFASMLVVGAVSLLWIGLRQPETLAPERRRPFSPGSILSGIREVLSIRSAMGYTLALGFSFAPFVAYLSTAQAVFQDTYGAGKLFPLYFGLLALSFGVVSLLNNRLIARRGMVRISMQAALFITVTSGISWAAAFAFGGIPPLWLFLAGMLAIFVGVGALWGNLNALAMEPLGHLAGIGAAVVAFLSSTISIIAGGTLGQAFDGKSDLLFLAFALFGALTSAAMRFAVGGRGKQ